MLGLEGLLALGPGLGSEPCRRGALEGLAGGGGRGPAAWHQMECPGGASRPPFLAARSLGRGLTQGAEAATEEMSRAVNESQALGGLTRPPAVRLPPLFLRRLPRDRLPPAPPPFPRPERGRGQRSTAGPPPLPPSLAGSSSCGAWAPQPPRRSASGAPSGPEGSSGCWGNGRPGGASLRIISCLESVLSPGKPLKSGPVDELSKRGGGLLGAVPASLQWGRCAVSGVPSPAQEPHKGRILWQGSPKRRRKALCPAPQQRPLVSLATRSRSHGAGQGQRPGPPRALLRPVRLRS